MVGGAVQETRSAILQNPQRKHHGQTAWIFLRRPGWQWEGGGGVQPGLYHRQAVWGTAGVLSSLALWFLTCQVKTVASRLEESWFVSDVKRFLFFGQFLSNKVGRELLREKEPLPPGHLTLLGYFYISGLQGRHSVHCFFH